MAKQTAQRYTDRREFLCDFCIQNVLKCTPRAIKNVPLYYNLVITLMFLGGFYTYCTNGNRSDTLQRSYTSYNLVTVTATINGLVKLLAFNAHIFPFLMPISFHPNTGIQSLFETRNGSCGYYVVWQLIPVINNSLAEKMFSSLKSRTLFVQF